MFLNDPYFFLGDDTNQTESLLGNDLAGISIIGTTPSSGTGGDSLLNLMMDNTSSSVIGGLTSNVGMGSTAPNAGPLDLLGDLLDDLPLSSESNVQVVTTANNALLDGLVLNNNGVQSSSIVPNCLSTQEELPQLISVNTPPQASGINEISDSEFNEDDLANEALRPVEISQEIEQNNQSSTIRPPPPPPSTEWPNANWPDTAAAASNSFHVELGVQTPTAAVRSTLDIRTTATAGWPARLLSLFHRPRAQPMPISPASDRQVAPWARLPRSCLLYTSDAADE